MSQIAKNIQSIRNQLQGQVRLVIVTKNHAPEIIMEAYNSGHRLFGENRAQELIDKQPILPSDIEWHFIGHLQTNKVKYIASFVSVIHSVDSLKLLREINKEALKNARVIDCLLQFHIAREETKFGLSMDEASEILANPAVVEMKNIRICGVMGMASFSDDKSLVRREFAELKSIFDILKEKYFSDDARFKELSMGMSGDWQIAVEEGSTLIRVGTAIFEG